MRLNRLGQKSVSQGDVFSMDLTQGKVSGIMLMGVFPTDDTKITVIVREKKPTVLANNLSVTCLNAITDFEYGTRSGQTATKSVGALADVSELGEGYKDLIERHSLQLETLYLPLGHITLSGKKELEVSVNYGNGNDTILKVCTVHEKDQPDFYYLYDEIERSVHTSENVRKVIINNGTRMLEGDVSQATVIDDYQIQIDEGDGNSRLFDASAAIGATAIFGRNETIQETQYLQVYRSTDVLPSTVRVKISGQTVVDPSIIFVKEYIPDSVKDSTLQNGRELIEKIKKIEREDPKAAENYKEAGIIPDSEQLEAIQTAKVTQR